MELISVILSGGAGSRLWPVSRELHPKPFMKLGDGESLLQKTFSRIMELPSLSEVMTVTNRDLYFKTEDEYEKVNKNRLATSFILEPVGRNTAPAVAVSALKALEGYGKDAVLLVLSADHLIENKEAFEEAVSSAVKLAEQGQLVTFGIQPTFPETGYGYIEAGKDDQLSLISKNCFSVKRFVEKPVKEKAREYIALGNYFWNSGMFCFTAGTIIDELKQYAPQVLNAAESSLKAARLKAGKNTSEVQLEADTFGQAPDISIDYAVMEKSDKVAVVTCDIGWSDIGSWNAVSKLTSHDENGNSIIGDALLHDVSNCYIHNEGRLVGAVGVKNLVIADTKDALLIADKSRSQDVKKIVSALKASEHDHHRTHVEVHRPWGTYEVLEEGKNYKIKRIVVKPGGQLSLQMHHHRSEHWIVISSIAHVTNDDNEFLLNTNESTYILAGHKHRLENPGLVDLVLIEVQSGEIVSEDDIVRFDDAYGRV